MNTQELFETMVNKTIAQGRACYFNGTCEYRHENEGDVYRCAVGQIITDENYDSIIEDYPLNERHTPLMHAIEESLGRPVTDEEIDIMVATQDAHDNAAQKEDTTFVRDFKANLRAYFEGEQPGLVDLEFLDD